MWHVWGDSYVEDNNDAWVVAVHSFDTEQEALDFLNQFGSGVEWALTECKKDDSTPVLASQRRTCICQWRLERSQA